MNAENLVRAMAPDQREPGQQFFDVAHATIVRQRMASEAEKAAKDPEFLKLGDFSRGAWQIVEPGRPYRHNWHIDAIIEHLEAVSRGQIQNLLINIMFRHLKSVLVSVLWPAWTWTFLPESRWVTTSYVEKLAVRDAVKTRRIMQSAWYRERWGTVFSFTGDQNVKSYYENNRTGFRRATGVKGAVSGEGGDVVTVDDPHNVKQAESRAEREGTLLWWDEVMSSRLNEPDKGARVIIMHRIHERDLSGHVLAQGGYEHLCLPARYRRKAYVTVLGNPDPRKRDGELLWPGRFSDRVLTDLELRMGTHAAAGQLQQEPRARKGGQFERQWFEIVDEVPREGIRGRYWDKAGSAGGGKYTAGALMSMHDGIWYVEDVVRGQWRASDREPVIKATAEKDARKYGMDGFVIWLEQEPASAGKESAEATIANLAGFRVFADRPTGDKFVRADPLAAQAKAGNVRLVRGAWNEAFLQELEGAGPGAEYLDQMDSAAGAFNMLARTLWVDEDDENVYDLEEVGGFVL